VQAVVDRFVNAVFKMDAVTWFGLTAVVALLFFYTLEDRSPVFILAFATACWMGVAYGYLQGSVPFEIVGGIWGLLALRKCWRDIQSRNHGAHMAEHLVLAWHVRLIVVLAVISGLILLIVDSPLSTYLPIQIRRGVAEAIPLILVGVAYLAWLAIDRPPTIDLMKQVLLALAFILWGVNLLMPAGEWSRFAGAVVIAIYVFDLAWLMEENLRRRFRHHLVNGRNGCLSPDCRSAGVCSCVEGSERARELGERERHADLPAASSKTSRPLT
jgi:hypothetical protein